MLLMPERVNDWHAHARMEPTSRESVESALALFPDCIVLGRAKTIGIALTERKRIGAAK